MKLALKAPGTKHLKLKYVEPPSNVASDLNLRYYTLAALTERFPNSPYAELGLTAGEQQKITELRLEKLGVVFQGRGLHSSTFRLNVSALCGIGVALRDCRGGF
jgi:hypothetical protein